MVYAKKVKATDPRFKDRAIGIYSSGSASEIPVPDTVVLCNGCNKNIYPDAGYLIYLGKKELDSDHPYDFYCENCKRRNFPKAKEVTNGQS